MQLLHAANKSSAGSGNGAEGKSAGTRRCAREILDAAPPLMWFIRREMRSRRQGLSVSQFRALIVIDLQPHASLSLIADRVGATLPTVSRLISGLVARGLVRREGGREDRRQIAVEITTRGREVLEAARSGTQDKLAEKLEHLPASKVKLLAEAMGSLREVFGSCRGNGAAVCDEAGTNEKAVRT